LKLRWYLLLSLISEEKKISVVRSWDSFIEEGAAFKSVLFTRTYIWLCSRASISYIHSTTITIICTISSLAYYLRYILQWTCNSLSARNPCIFLKMFFNVSKILAAVFYQASSQILSSIAIIFSISHSHLMSLVQFFFSVLLNGAPIAPTATDLLRLLNLVSDRWKASTLLLKRRHRYFLKLGWIACFFGVYFLQSLRHS
jgi:hypothetical protein